MLEEAGWKMNYSDTGVSEDGTYGMKAYTREFWEHKDTGKKRTIEVVKHRW